jgi:hypothetical protein
VSQAQERSCERHVTVATIDRYGREGDPTAIRAANQLSAYQDAEDGQ